MSKNKGKRKTKTIEVIEDNSDIETDREEEEKEGDELSEKDDDVHTTRSRAPLSQTEMQRLIREIKKELKYMQKTLNRRNNQKYFEEEVRNKQMYDDMIEKLNKISKKYGPIVKRKRAIRYIYLTDDARDYINQRKLDENQPDIGNIIPHAALTKWLYRMYKDVGVYIDEDIKGSVLNRRYIEPGKKFKRVINWKEDRIYYSQTQTVISRMVHRGITPSQEKIDEERENIMTFEQFLVSS